MYTPSNYVTGGGSVPFKGDPYYFPMFLTFYLQELGTGVSYLVKTDEIKESFFKKTIEVIDRYEKNKHLSNETLFSTKLYPRNEKQIMILKIANKIVRTLDNFKLGQSLLTFMRNDSINYDNQYFVNGYIINKTSHKKHKKHQNNVIVQKSKKSSKWGYENAISGLLCYLSGHNFFVKTYFSMFFTFS